LSKGGSIYYSDTDSIVTDLELDNNMVDSKEIGKLKLEHVIDKGIFISGKLYSFFDKQDNLYVKAKGVDSNSLSYSDFVDLLHNKNLTTGIKTQSKINWTEGYVDIVKTNLTIHSNNYQSRTKIYDKDNIWINTKPIFINTYSIEEKKILQYLVI